jgi:hypothetical protein
MDPFENSDSTERAEVLSEEAHGLGCAPLEVGLASEARSKTWRWRSRKDENERPRAWRILTWWVKD